MNIIQESKLSMYLAVRDFLLQNATVTATLPNFSTFMGNLQNCVTQIQSLAEKQEFDRSGFSASKDQARKVLSQNILDYSRRLVAYAQYAKNLTLLAEVKTTATKLTREADTSLKDIAQRLYDRASANLSSLAAYGINASTQTAFLSTINSYNTIIPRPRLGITDKKQATSQLTVLFKTAADALTNITILIETLKISQPVFYTGFKSARKLVITGMRSLALRGIVVENEEGEPISGATIKISNKGAGEKSASKPVIIEKKSADKGGFTVKSLAEGHYSIMVSKPGYKTTELPFIIDATELANLEIELEKE